MTTISGADVDRLQELAVAMRGGGEALGAVRTRLDVAVPALSWSGPDRERFALEWQARFAPALAAVGEALDAAGRAAGGHAAEQVAASSTGAGGTAPATGAATGTAVDGQAAEVGQSRYGEPTGELSARYESRGDVGSVSTGRGDPGGVSYGTYQLATNRGTPADYVEWAREHHPASYERLQGLRPGSAAFGQAWRELAAADAAGFGQAQHDFIVQSHYRPGVDRIVARVPELSLEGRSDVVADVVWSTTVQHGAGGAATVFANALRGEDVAGMSDADLVRAVYAERGRDDGMAYFSGSRADVRAGVVDRFRHEQADALRLLGDGAGP